MGLNTDLASTPEIQLHSVLREPVAPIRSRWVDVLFYLFCILSLVGTSPFTDRDPDVFATLSSDQSNLPRQILNIAFFVYFFSADFAEYRRGRPWPIPFLMQLFVLLAFCSVFWSLAPDRTLRRSVGLFFALYTAFSAVRMVGAERSIHILTRCLALVAIVDLASVFFIQNAIHVSNGFDAETVVGAWRGLFFHKNVAGPVTALSLPFFAYQVICQRRTLFCVPIVAAIVFLIGTSSKTGMSVALVETFMCVVMWPLNRSRIGRAFIRGGVIGFALALIIYGAFWFEDIKKMVLQPDFATGRGSIWAISVHYIEHHFWLGSGYGAFWQIGNPTPSLRLAELRWLQQTAQTHNGFLEVASNLGVPGAILAVYASFFTPIVKSLKRIDQPIMVLCLQVLLAAFVLNFTESRIFQGFREEWMIQLIAIAAIWNVGSYQNAGPREK